MTAATAGPISERKICACVALLAIALAAAFGLVPASALAGTLDNGNYTAAPGETNLLNITYDPGTDIYTYSDFAGITDGDGLGGCSVITPPPGNNRATCPAAVVSHINITLLDGNDQAILTPTGSSPGQIPSTRPVSLAATIEGGDGNDYIEGGGGSDLISGGPGDDNLRGNAGNDTLLGGEGNDNLIGDGGCTALQAPHPFCGPANPPTAGVDHLDGGPGWDAVNGLEGTVFNGPQIVGFDPSMQRPDALICGTGDDTPIGDYAQPGTGDDVSSDCEAVSQWAICPTATTGNACEGTVTVEAKATGGTSAAASAKKKGRKIIVGKARLYAISAGTSTLVTVTLNPRRLQRVLRGRKRASAQSVVRLGGRNKKGKKSLAAQQAKKKSRVIGRTSFVLTKG